MNIAFIDHHLNNYHANKFLDLLHGPLAEYGLKVSVAFETHPEGEDWCVKNGIQRAASIEEAVALADAVLVLAPDNIETHSEFAKQVLPLGKPTMFDKLLANTREEALEIADLAKQHSVPIFSASSLRYAVELEAVLPGSGEVGQADMFARGMGALNHYGIHTLSLVLRGMGFGVKRLIDTGTASTRNITLDYGNGRRAVLNLFDAANAWEHFTWSFALREGDKYHVATLADFDGFYANLMRRTARFFLNGETDLTVENMVETVSILQGANESLAAGGEWIELG